MYNATVIIQRLPSDGPRYHRVFSHQSLRLFSDVLADTWRTFANIQQLGRRRCTRMCDEIRPIPRVRSRRYSTRYSSGCTFEVVDTRRSPRAPEIAKSISSRVCVGGCVCVRATVAGPSKDLSLVLQSRTKGESARRRIKLKLTHCDHVLDSLRSTSIAAR